MYTAGMVLRNGCNIPLTWNSSCPQVDITNTLLTGIRIMKCINCGSFWVTIRSKRILVVNDRQLDVWRSTRKKEKMKEMSY